MAKFFIGRPIVAIAILTVIGGLVAMAKLPVAQLPDIVPPQINESATYTGADAVTIEQSVATPLEQQMNGVDNMLYMMSTNANDGTMTLKVTYDVGTNVDIDQVNTQNRVSQASPNLPTSVNQYGVTVKKLMGLPLLVLSLYSPNGTYNGQFLGNYATINVNDALLRVPGVGQVTNFGAADYAMRIWLKPDQLTKLGLTVTDLTNAVMQQSAVNPAGQIGAENAILIVEFAILEHAKGKELVDAALEGARLRLRPILMTSFAFILGCVPLWTAKGAGAIGRRVLGSSVVTGMGAASALGIFFVPVLFVVVERIATKKKTNTVVVPDKPVLEGGHD